MSNLNNFVVMLCPNADIAKTYYPEVTVEAEYGDICVNGSVITLAHHGSRSHNPAPCNTNVKSISGGVIVISHLDLDTLGGIMAVTGDKIEDDAFWAGAELIDVKGPHHMYELDEEVQNKLNAYEAWRDAQPRGERHENAVDVTKVVEQHYSVIQKILDKDNPSHNAFINMGIEWKENNEEEIERKCVGDYEDMRVFRTDGIFCAGSYYSKKYNRIVPATITYNEQYKNITVAFEDGGENYSARKLVQSLWGEEAGGRDGIAGSPRGKEMSEEDFLNIQKVVREEMRKTHS